MHIIDVHSHIYPEKIADKASHSIADFYRIDARTEGTSAVLLEEGRAAGIDVYVVNSVATNVRQVRRINEFLLSEVRAHPEFRGLIALHPDMDEGAIRDEIEWGILNGFKGIKLHPDFQHFYLDEPRAKKIYRAASGKLPILFHTGDSRFNFSSPGRMAKVAEEFPDLICIAAHFGGWSEWNQVGVYKGLGNVYVDTSSTLAFISPDEAKRYIDYFGAEWFLFGVDFPMWNASEELERFMKVDVSLEEREMILWKNASALIGIDLE